jgi:DNA invertase Pin-like site-specific DNA recombinase
MIRAGIYARKSTDDSDKNAEARSTTRQVERATEYALAQGWTVDDRYVFRDEAVSGAEWKRRPAFNALLGALEPKPPFDVLIVSELSRLGRDPRTLAAVMTIEDAGVEIHGYLKGRKITLHDEAGEIDVRIEDLVSSLERRRARSRSYDAIRRRAEAGAVANGAAPYGYRNVRDGAGYVYLVIDQGEAVVVVRIFTMYADGVGMTTIAHTLNAEGIPSPRTWRASRSWTPSAIRGMLRRPLYAGAPSWNKTQRIMRRGTKGQRRRPESDWIERSRPELAIIEPELWQRVQARFADRAAAIVQSGGRRHPDHSNYLLVGFARCSTCGGPIGTDLRAHGSGERRRHVAHYACLDHKKRGNAICANAVGLGQSVLDRAILDAIVGALDPRVIEVAIDKAIAMLSATESGQAERREKVDRELLRTQSRIDRLVGALADATLPADEIRPQLAAEKGRKTALQDELAQIDRTVGATVDVATIRQRVQTIARDVAEVFSGATSEARQALRALLGGGRIELEPFGSGRQRGYRFRGELNIGHVITGDVNLRENTSARGCTNLLPPSLPRSQRVRFPSTSA